MKAKVKWFNNEKGYGFLVNDISEDIFVHYTEIGLDGYKTLKEGTEVEFELLNTEKGYQAKNIKICKELEEVK